MKGCFTCDECIFKNCSLTFLKPVSSFGVSYLKNISKTFSKKVPNIIVSSSLITISFTDYHIVHWLPNIIVSSSLITISFTKYTLFYKQPFYKQHQNEIGKKTGKTKAKQHRKNFCNLKAIHFLHPCYHPKLIWEIVKNIAKSKCVCFNQVTVLIVMKIRVKLT